MSFLAPLFLLGGAAIALPLIFHLVRRATRERVAFSSLLFLRTTPPRLNRRSRLEHLLLLALRCLLICLLAFAFARPFLKRILPGESRPPAAERLHILVDGSASMRRGTLWAQALERTRAIIEKAGPETAVAVSIFGRGLRPLISFSEWSETPPSQRKGLVERKLADQAPTWEAGHVANAVTEAAETLAETESRSALPGRVVLISDLQQSIQLQTLQEYEWPKGVSMSLEKLRLPEPANASLQVLPASAEVHETPTVTIRVSNSPGSAREQFEVGWVGQDRENFVVSPEKIYVPAGQNRTLGLAPPESAAVTAIALRGDSDGYDNIAYFLPSKPAKTTVLYFGDDSPTDPHQGLYYLQRAFQQTRWQQVDVVSHTTKSASPPIQDDAKSLLLMLAGPFPEATVDWMRARIEAGATLLVDFRSVAMAPTVARLLQLQSFPAEDAESTALGTPGGVSGGGERAREDTRPYRDASYAMLGEIDFQHPMFAPFADPRYSDFTKIRFWRHRRVDPAAIAGARTIASFDNGDPALLQVGVGKGRLLLMTSGWQPDDSQFALSTKFVPFLYGILDYAGAGITGSANYRVGDLIELQAGGGSNVRVRGPENTETDLPAGTSKFSGANAPGLYTIEASTTNQVVVNLDPSESASERFSVDDLEALGVPLQRPEGNPVLQAENRARLAKAQVEARQQLWRWIILLGIAILFLETFLAGRTYRRSEVGRSGKQNTLDPATQATEAA